MPKGIFDASLGVQEISYAGLVLILAGEAIRKTAMVGWSVHTLPVPSALCIPNSPSVSRVQQHKHTLSECLPTAADHGQQLFRSSPEQQKFIGPLCCR